MKNKSLPVLPPHCLTRSWPLLGALILLAGFNLQADVPPTTLHLTCSGADTEGLATYRLDWNAVSNATYVVQSATDLAAPDPWQTIEVVTPTNSAGLLEIKGRSIPENSAEYFRLILPQPQIFSIEPAIFAPGVAVNAFVIGQCFESTDVVRVGGVAVSGVIYVAGGLLECTLPPQSAGPHVVELVRGGVVKASFTVTCADPLTNPELVLQGPPIEPPASPHAKITKSRSNIQNNRMGGWRDQDDDGDGTLDYPSNARGGKITKSRSNIQNNRLGVSRIRTGDFDGDSDNVGDRLLPAPQTRTTVDSWASVVEMTTGGGGVQPFSGEVQECAVDLVIPGRGLDFIWARTYRSRTGPSTAQGQRWDYSYNISLATQSDGSVVLRPGNGRADAFYPNSSGGWSRPEYFVEIGDLDSDGFPDVVTFADSGKWVFHSLLGGSAPGMLSQIIDRNGNTMRLHYDGAGKLAQVVDDLDRTNTVAYNVAGQIASVTDFSGRTVRYEYDGTGDLVACVSPPVIGTPNGNDFPGGKTNTYTYSSGYLDDRENHLLLTARDAKGQVQYEHVYQHNQTNLEFLRCISIQRGTNVPTTFSYLPQTPTPANQFATLRCIVNDPVGNVTECYFDARNRAVKLQEFTGRAAPGVPVTATVNRPTGKLRQTDPDSYETLAQWNNDSLCRKMYLFGGQQVECTYESDFEKSTPARKRADCRVVREIASEPVDSDGDLLPDATERVWRYEYDPRFGSDPTASRGIPKGSYLITRLGSGMAAAKGRLTCRKTGEDILEGRKAGGGPKVFLPGGDWDSKSKSEAQEETQAEVDQASCFATSITDPRGIVTTGSYDANGNYRKIGLQAGARVSLVVETGHNSSGQLTAITNAPDANGYRRVDTFEYYTNGPAAGYLQKITTDRLGHELTHVVQQSPRGRITSITDPRGHDTLYTYNALDQLVRYQSPTNLTARCTTDFTYDANDNLVESATELRDENDAFVRMIVTKGTFDVLNRLVAVANQVSASQFVTNKFFYDANDNVVAVHSPLAVSGADPHAITQIAYDERGLPFQTIAAPGSPDQSTTQWDYDANGNVTRVSEGLEGTPSITTMEYDGFAGFGSDSSPIAKGSIQGLRSEAIALRAKEDTDQIVASGTLNQKGDLAHGGNCGEHAYSLQFEHGDMDRPVVLGSVWGSQLAKGNTSVGGAYMRNNRLSKTTDPLGNVTTLHYDANDNLKVARHFGQLNDTPGTNGNVRLAESRYDYDGLDRPVRARDAFFSLPSQTPIGDGERTTTFAYAPNGQCTNVMDDLGRVTRFGYDTAGRSVSITDARGNIQVAVRDAFGNTLSSTSIELSDLGGPPQVFSRTNVYDALNRCVTTTDNVGNSISFAYDSRGNCVRSTDPNGNVTVYAYDGLSRPVSSTSYQGATTTIVSSSQSDYDDNDRCTSSTDANTNTTFYAYDSQNRLTQTTQADGTHHSLVWSPRSNLISETDANGTVINRTYDLNDRCISNNITPGAGVATTTTFETFAYDGASRLVAATNDVSHSEFDYDSHGNLTGNHADGWQTLSAYDSVGNRLSLTYPSGRVVTYAYDSLDQCTNIVESSVVLASFAYDGPGRVARIAYANGMRTRIFYDGISGVPNASGDFGHGQVSRILHAMNGGSPQISEVRLAWDRNGNKTKRDDAIFSPAIPRTNSLMLDYDGADRLTEAVVLQGPTLLRDTVYGLDRMGNRTNVSGAASCSGSYFMDGAIPGPLDFQMNQYTATPCDTRTYDENGNLTGRSSPATGPTSYLYDYADRLVQAQSVDLSSGSAVITTSSFAYDALGRRIAKTVSSGGLPPVTTQYVCDVTPYKDGEANEMSSRVIEERENGTVAASFVLDGTRSQDDGVIQMRRGGQDYYYHTDDQGNALALTTTGGAVLERYDYDDYGKVTFLTSDGIPTSATSSSVGNPYCWQGLRLDTETGLHNNDGGDFHDPQTGRAVRGKLKDIKDTGMGYIAVRGKVKSVRDMGSGRATGNNPWSDGGGGHGPISGLSATRGIAIDIRRP